MPMFLMVISLMSCNHCIQSGRVFLQEIHGQHGSIDFEPVLNSKSINFNRKKNAFGKTFTKYRETK